MLDFFNDYPAGYDLSILQTNFIRSKKDPKTGKWSKPVLNIIAKDNITGEKIKTEIVEPQYEYYITKDDKDLPYHHFSIRKEYVKPVICNHSELLKSIAENTNNMDFFMNNIRNGNWRENEKLHTINRVFFSDMNIEDHYRFWFSRKFKNTYKPATVGFFDIEVDVIDIAGDFPEPGEAPVSVITYIFNNVIHTYIHRNTNNPKIKEFEEDFNNGIIVPDLFKLIESSLNGKERMKYFGLDNLKVDIQFFDDEIEVIGNIFSLINREKPDFVLAWNIEFDLTYLIARIEVLGYKPEDIICHRDFKYKSCFYYTDTRSKDSLEERGDYANISSYTVYLDQMITFASRRKGQQALPSNKLNDVGNILCGVQKLDYHDITSNIAKLPYLDFKTYVFYNIIDVIVQICIEHETNDVAYVYSSSILNNTRFSKIHRQTVYLTNKMISYIWNKGEVFGNNINKFKEKKKEKFLGAYVADPLLTSNFSKYKVKSGKPMMLFNNLVDFDFAALYPTIIRVYNLSPTTQIGKLIFQRDGLTEKENETLGEDFIKDIVTDDSILFCKNWLGLPGFEELSSEVRKMMSMNIMKPKFGKYELRKGNIERIEDVEYDNSIRVSPFIIDTNKPISPFIYCKPMERSVNEMYYKGK